MKQVSIAAGKINCSGGEAIVVENAENYAATRTASIEVRFSGALLALFGGVLAVGTAAAVFAVSDIAAQIEKFGAANFFAATPTQKAIAFAVVAAFFVFGAWCFFGGVFQIATGRRVRGLRFVSGFLDSTAAFVVETLLFF